ncbi:MAG: hypothetical protein AVDCRST_MAG80-1283, partial [uncultured Rubrobacteraceae bacterium]
DVSDRSEPLSAGAVRARPRAPRSRGALALRAHRRHRGSGPGADHSPDPGPRRRPAGSFEVPALSGAAHGSSRRGGGFRASGLHRPAAPLRPGQRLPGPGPRGGPQRPGLLSGPRRELPGPGRRGWGRQPQPHRRHRGGHTESRRALQHNHPRGGPALASRGGRGDGTLHGLQSQAARERGARALPAREAGEGRGDPHAHQGAGIWLDHRPDSCDDPDLRPHVGRSRGPRRRVRLHLRRPDRFPGNSAVLRSDPRRRPPDSSRLRRLPDQGPGSRRYLRGDTPDRGAPHLPDGHGPKRATPPGNGHPGCPGDGRPPRVRGCRPRHPDRGRHHRPARRTLRKAFGSRSFTQGRPAARARRRTRRRARGVRDAPSLL